MRTLEAPVYPDDLLPQLQQTLALLADVETRYEIDRDYLESWSGPRAVRDSLVAELEQCHRANLERLRAYLSENKNGSLTQIGLRHTSRS